MKYVKTLILSAVVSSMTFTTAMASEATDKNWSQQLRAQGIAAADQSYCFLNEKGEIEGSNVNMRIRLASVSKLLTSLWAVEKLGLDFKYDIKLFVKGNNLHIQGSYDPFLGNEKMFYLVSQLNSLGYKKFDTVTFDKNLLINPNAQYYGDQYPTMNATTNARYIRQYFNTQSWSTVMKEEYSTFQSLAKAGRFNKVVNLEVTNVKFVEENPLKGDEETKELTLSAPALYKYLKEMNVKSNNYVADTLYRHLGGSAKFQEFLLERFNLTREQIRFYTGSGLPAIIEGVRKDNYASCSIILDLISELKKSSEKQNMEIEDVVAVPGSDKGTFRNRLFPSDYTNAFVAKTGTLMHTSALAGAMNTQQGFSFFGVFNQTTDAAGAKVVQNSMVKSIMTDLGGPKAFDYNVEGFHTYSNETLKNFNDDAEMDDFSTIEEGLY